MPDYFTTKPEPAPPKKRNEIPRESKRKIAHREALGLPQPFRTTPPSGKPIKKKARKPTEYARIYGSKSRVAWVKLQPCVVVSVDCWRTIDNAHTANGGTGRKADADTIVPLCRFHHMRLHWWGVESFEANYGVDLTAEAAHTQTLWLLECGRIGVDPESGAAVERGKE